MESDRQYYMRRAAEELQAAERAQCRKAELLHRTLAERYSDIVKRQPNDMIAAAEEPTATN